MSAETNNLNLTILNKLVAAKLKIVLEELLFNVHISQDDVKRFYSFAKYQDIMFQ